MTPELTPETDIESLLDDPDAESMRTSELQRWYLERWARGMAGSDLSLGFTTNEGETARVNYAPDPPEITVPAWEIPQPVTNFDRPTYDNLMQHMLTLHEVGHLLYTDEEVAAAAEETVTSEYQSQYRQFFNALEDGAVEEQLRQDFSVTTELGIMNANYMSRPQGELGLMDAILGSCLDLGVYDTGTLRQLADPENGSLEFSSDADRETFESDIFETLVEAVREVRTETDPAERVQAAREAWQEIEPHLEEADDPSGDQVVVNDAHPAPADGDGVPQGDPDQVPETETEDRIEELIDSIDGLEEPDGQQSESASDAESQPGTTNRSQTTETDAEETDTEQTAQTTDTGGPASVSGEQEEESADGERQTDTDESTGEGKQQEPETAAETAGSVESDAQAETDSTATSDERERGDTAPDSGQDESDPEQQTPGVEQADEVMGEGQEAESEGQQTTAGQDSGETDQTTQTEAPEKDTTPPTDTESETTDAETDGEQQSVDGTTSEQARDQQQASGEAPGEEADGEPGEDQLVEDQSADDEPDTESQADTQQTVEQEATETGSESQEPGTGDSTESTGEHDGSRTAGEHEASRETTDESEQASDSRAATERGPTDESEDTDESQGEEERQEEGNEEVNQAATPAESTDHRDTAEESATPGTADQPESEAENSGQSAEGEQTSEHMTDGVQEESAVTDAESAAETADTDDAETADEGSGGSTSEQRSERVTDEIGESEDQSSEDRETTADSPEQGAAGGEQARTGGDTDSQSGEAQPTGTREGGGEISLPDDNRQEGESQEPAGVHQHSEDQTGTSEEESEDSWTADIDNDPSFDDDLMEEYRQKAQDRLDEQQDIQDREADELEALQETIDEVDDLRVRELEIVDGPVSGSYRSNEATDIRDQSRRLARILGQQLQKEQRSDYRHGRRQGELDTREVHRLQYDDYRVFRQETSPDEKDYDAVFVLDRSGSMSTDIRAAERATAALSMALDEIDVESCIIDMYRNEPRVAKPFGVDIEHKLDAILTGDYSGGTPLSPCLQLAREHLRKRDSYPFMIVVTDGRPSNEDKYENELKRTNFPVLGVYLDFTARGPNDVPTSVRESGNLFDRRKIITDKDSLIPGLRRLCQGVMF